MADSPKRKLDEPSGILLASRCHPIGGEALFMAAGEGYVMARRRSCYPFVVTVSEWIAWPTFPRDTDKEPAK